MTVTLPLSYVDPPDCPPGMTLDEYRRLRARTTRRTPRRRVSRLRSLRAARRRRVA